MKSKRDSRQRSSSRESSERLSAATWPALLWPVWSSLRIEMPTLRQCSLKYPACHKKPFRRIERRLSSKIATITLFPKLSNRFPQLSSKIKSLCTRQGLKRSKRSTINS